MSKFEKLCCKTKAWAEEHPELVRIVISGAGGALLFTTGFMLGDRYALNATKNGLTKFVKDGFIKISFVNPFTGVEIAPEAGMLMMKTWYGLK